MILPTGTSIFAEGLRIEPSLPRLKLIIKRYTQICRIDNARTREDSHRISIITKKKSIYS